MRPSSGLPCAKVLIGAATRALHFVFGYRLANAVNLLVQIAFSEPVCEQDLSEDGAILQSPRAKGRDRSIPAGHQAAFPEPNGTSGQLP